MKIYLDRIDYDNNGEIIATFELDEDFVRIKGSQMPNGFAETLVPNAVVECEISDGLMRNPKMLLEETKLREEKMRGKLKSLFEK